jgi:hypothetical protein
MSPSHGVLPLRKAVLITSGDLRQAANQTCWPAQEELERKLTQAFQAEGVALERAFPVDPATRLWLLSRRCSMCWAFMYICAAQSNSIEGPIQLKVKSAGATLQPWVSCPV